LAQTGGVSEYMPSYLTAQVLAVYAVSLFLSLFQTFTVLTDRYARLEQNVGIVAANALPMGPLFSRRARQFSRAKTPGADSTRTMARLGSRPSTRQGTNYGSRPGTSRSTNSKRSSFIDLKRSTTLIIEGPRRMSLDVTDMRDDGYDDIDSDGRSIRSEDGFDLEAWPNGIIKTVSVEVIEETNPDHVPGGHSHTPSSTSIGVGSIRDGSRAGIRGHSAKGSEVSIEQDWETMLRQGPPV
jgi:hypothetical protein